MRVVPIGTHTAKIVGGPEDRAPRVGFFRKAMSLLSTTSAKGWSMWLDNTYTGKHVTDETAMRLTTVWACVRLLAETVGSLPVNVFENTKSGGKEKTREHPINAILLQPNRYMTWVEYMEAMQYNLVLLGNSYALDDFNGAEDISSTMPMLANGMSLSLADNGDIQYKYAGPNGKQTPYTERDITHIKGFGANGMIGLSPIGHARETMGATMAAEEYGARFFANSATPRGLLTMPGFLKPDQREQARKMFEGMHGGLENAHKLAILEGGMTYTPVGLPPADSQFIEVMNLGLHAICQIFGISPHMAGDLSHATFSNIEHLDLELSKYRLRPYLTRYEQRMNMRWIKKSERGRFFIKFNLEGLLRGDTASRANFYSQMVQNGIYTRNECRDLEDRNPIEGGDELTAQVNLAPLEMLGKQGQEAVAAGPPEAPAEPAPAPGKADEDRFNRVVDLLEKEIKRAPPLPPQVNVNVPPPVTHVRVESPVINIAPPDITVNVPPNTEQIDSAIKHNGAAPNMNGVERVLARDENGLITKIIDRPI